MKICPVCTREYANERTHCADDGIGLVALSTGAKTRPEELLGQIVDGRYRVERIVGRGGMGTVYAGTHVVVGKPVAIKVLKPGVDRSEGVLQRFIREAQTANSIRSRHIVETFDFGQLRTGSFFVVMELLEGMDLTRVMRRGMLDRTQLVHVFIQVAETLHLAHVQGVVHRDLKPDNVFLVNEAGDPLFAKLLDFGIAKILHDDPTGLTETGVILGTPYYMSPEQARAEHVDHRSDIYALGVMMYRAFTGKLPFVADSTMGVLTRHITEAPEMPSRISEIDVPTERVILRCMEKRPADRFQTMEEVAATLRAVQRGRAPVREDPTVHEGVSGPWPEASGAAQPNLHTPLSWVPPGTPSGAHQAAVSGSVPASGRASRPGSGAGTPPPGLSSGPHRISSAPHAPIGSGPHSASASGPFPASSASASGPYPASTGSDRHAAMGSGPHPAAASGPHAGLPPHSVPGSGPYPSMGSGPHPTPSSNTPYPPSGAYGSLPPGYQGEQPTSRGLVTTSTGAVTSPRRGALVVASGALMMVAVGAAVAFGLYGGPAPAESGAPASGQVAAGTVAAAPPLEAPRPPEPVIAPPLATASAAALPATASADAAKPRSARPPTIAPPKPAVSASAAPAPTPTRRPTEIRSPFD